MLCPTQHRSRGQPPAYYYYQTYLLVRAKKGNLDGDTLESLLAQTGLLNTPLSGQTLHAIGALFGVKGFDACNRDLAEHATRIGGLKFADEVNAAQRAIGDGEPQTCTHPVALHIIRRAADLPIEVPDR